MNSILFAGGDARTLAAISYMKNQGFHVISYAINARLPVDGSKASAVILPFPCLKNGRLNAPTLQSPPTVEEMIRETGIDPKSAFVLGDPMADCPFARYTDLSQSEELKTRNAVTTAEGALDALIRNTDVAVFGLPVMVIGYGAIGKRLSRILQALGARVTVAARRREHRVCGEYAGHTVQDVKNLSLQGIRAVFNTVPAPVITPEVLKTCDATIPFFELASAPGGFDGAQVEQEGHRVIPCPALPGKVAPITAGEDLAKVLLSQLPTLQKKGSGTSVRT